MTPKHSPQIELVCVSHDWRLYDRYIRTNPNLRNHNLIHLDNRSVNVGLSQRYNEFLNSRIAADAWIVFLHHDFEFHEDPANVVAWIPRDSIYGPVGARMADDVEPGRADSGRSGSMPWQIIGEIGHPHELDASARVGQRISEPQIVDTVDSCCLIVHSSLIARHGLRFDPNLSWHLYCEDFCLSAWFAHRIQTYAVQIECGHYGLATKAKGFDEEEFDRSADYLMNKHKGRRFASTCSGRIHRRRRRTRQPGDGITVIPTTDAAVAKR